MDKQLAAVAIQFMQRMTIQGNEVPAFTAVMTALNGIMAGTLVVQQAEPREPTTLRIAGED